MGKLDFHRKSLKRVEAFSMAGPTGFEPAISSVTGRRVRPDYTTGPSLLGSSS